MVIRSYYKEGIVIRKVVWENPDGSRTPDWLLREYELSAARMEDYELAALARDELAKRKGVTNNGGKELKLNEVD